MSASPTLTGTLGAAAATFSGAVTLGDASADAITVNGTVTSNLIFTDNTYDIGASGATRPRTGYFGTSVISPLVDATNLEVTNLKALDGTAAGSIANSTGVVTLASSVLTTTDINGGTIDGTAIGGSTAAAGAFTTLTSNGATTFTAGTASTSTTTGTAVITGGLGVSGRINAANFDGIVGANTAAAGAFTTLSATGVTTVQAGTVSAPAITTTGDTNTGIFFPAADTIAFSEGGVEAMRIDTNSNVGIGTTSSATRLHVVGTAAYDPLRLESTVSGYERSWTIGPNVGISGQFVIRDTTAGENRVNIDSAGNMGLGVTPSAWYYPAVSLANGSFYSRPDPSSGIAANAYSSTSGGGWKYIATAAATRYEQSAGTHTWSYAASGTAGNTISFTQAMTLDASGNLVIGTTEAAQGKLDVRGALAISNSTTSYWKLDRNDSDGSLQFIDTSTERARIDSSGNLLVGSTTSPSGSGNIFVATTAFIGTTNADPTNNRVTGMQVRSDGRLYTRANGSWDVGISSTSGAHMTFYTDNGSARVGAGNISSNGSTTTYGTGSDYRMKTDVHPMTGALEKVLQLAPVTYKWVAGLGGTKESGQGFIAHELQAIVPECVIGEKDAVDADGKPVYQGIDTSFLVATLTAAIKEQQAIITSLTDRITALEQA
jgi:hypothetical protein